jgi:hypothetical protein
VTKLGTGEARIVATGEDGDDKETKLNNKETGPKGEDQENVKDMPTSE